jgi:acetyl esterase/lipase
MVQGALVARVVVCAVIMLTAVLPSQIAGAQGEHSPIVTLDRVESLSRVDLVTVTATGFQPSEGVRIEQCAVAGGGAPRCQSSTARVTSADGTGALLESFVVTADITPTAGDTIDCRAAAGACVVIVTGASGKASAPVPLAFAPASPPRGRFLDEVFPEVEVTKDVPYGEAVDVNGNRVVLTLDLYQPAGDNAPERPVVMWIHGGGFQRGFKEMFAAHSEAFARRGYVTATINYRLRGRFADASTRAYEDATAAVAWLRRNASTYRIDPDAIAAGGGSAGAVTALNLAYGPDLASGQRSPIAAAISLNGLPTIGRAEPGEPPSIFFHGTEDIVAPYAPARDACDGIRASGVRCDFVTYHGVPHGLGNASSPFAPHIFETSAQFLFEVLVRPAPGGSPAVPTSKADCKHGGWRNVVSDRGQSFRNQGQCVSFVARRCPRRRSSGRPRWREPRRLPQLGQQLARSSASRCDRSGRTRRTTSRPGSRRTSTFSTTL